MRRRGFPTLSFWALGLTLALACHDVSLDTTQQPDVDDDVAAQSDLAGLDGGADADAANGGPDLGVDVGTDAPSDPLADAGGDVGPGDAGADVDAGLPVGVWNEARWNQAVWGL